MSKYSSNVRNIIVAASLVTASFGVFADNSRDLGSSKSELIAHGSGPVQIESKILYGEGRIWNGVKAVAKSGGRILGRAKNPIKALNYLDGCGYVWVCGAHSSR